MKIEQINKNIRAANIVVFALLCVVVVVVYLLCCRRSFIELPLVKGVALKEETSYTLFPSSDTPNRLLPDLTQILTFLGRNSRLDATASLPTLSIGLKESSETLQLCNGETGYLCKKDGKWAFSSDPTPLSFFPLGGLHVDAKLSLDDVHDRGLVVLDEEHRGVIPGLDELIASPLLPGDVLLKYIGDEKGAYPRLSRSDGSILYITDGLKMSWSGTKWVSGVSMTESYPLAIAHTTPNQGVFFEVWDQSGFLKTELTLGLFESNGGESIDIQNVKQRSVRRISCLLDGKEALLTKGEWFVKQDGAWRATHSFDVAGDLFVIDGIEQTSCQGVFFSADRTYQQRHLFSMKPTRPSEKGHSLTKRLVKEL